MRTTCGIAAGILFFASTSFAAELPGVVEPSGPPPKPNQTELRGPKPPEPAKPPEAVKPPETPKPPEPAKPPEAVKPPETPKPPEPAKPPEGSKPRLNLPPKPGPEGLRQKALDLVGDPKSEPKDRYEACTVLTLFDDNEVVTALRKTARWDTDAEVRIAAIFALGQMARKEAAPDLVAILSEKNPKLRVMAAAQLGFIAEPSTAKALVGALKDATFEVRAAAATSLGRMRAEEGFEPVLALFSDGQPQVRAEAAAAVGRYRNPKALEPLLALLKDPDPRPRVQALRGLMRQPSESIANAAIALRKDPDDGVRLAVMELLGVAQAWKGEGLETLLAGLGDSDAGVRSTAILALAGSGNAEAGRRIAKLLSPRIESLPGVRMAAAATLAQFRTLPEAGEALAAALGDYDERVRSVATSSFGWFPESIAIPAMQKSLDDPSTSVRSGAASFLSRFKSRREVQEALAAFEKRETRIRAASSDRPVRTFLDDNTF